jgi:prepilin peptidase CpaA
LSATAQYLLLLLFPPLVTLGAASDALTMTIPDRLSLALVGGFFVLAPIAGLDGATIALHGVAAAIVLAAAFALFACGWIGGGDAKFAAAIALWLGWSHLLAFAVTTAVSGGVLALAVLGLQRTMPPAAAQVGRRFPCLRAPCAGLPLAVALAAAALFVYPKSIWMSLIAG